MWLIMEVNIEIIIYINHNRAMDDTYVHLPNLLDYLGQFDETVPLFIGMRQVLLTLLVFYSFFFVIYIFLFIYYLFFYFILFFI